MKRIQLFLFVCLLMISVVSCISKSKHDDSEEQLAAKACPVDGVSDNTGNGFNPERIIVSEIKNGDRILDRDITSFEYVNERNFRLQVLGEFELIGNLSYGENSALVFTPVEEWRSKATLCFNEIEKPLYMWIEMNNEDDFISSLTEEQLAQAKNMEMPRVKIRLKNYEVVAADYLICAYADFMEILE